MNELKQIDEFRKVLANYQLSDHAKQILADTRLVLLVGPTSSGRNTIINELLTTGDFYNIVSDTTREPRTKDGVLIEKNGREYWFRDEKDLLADLQKGDFLEAAIIHNQQVSGVSIREIEAAHQANQVAITDIEPTGEATIRALKPDVMTIFVIPPSFDEWMVRMRGRGELPADEVKRRLQSAVAEIETALDSKQYQFVVNDTFKHTARDIREIADGVNQDDDAAARDIATELLVDTRRHLAED